MNDGARVGPRMVTPALETANRRLIEAMEAPPETGVESQLDGLAAVTWHYAAETDRSPDPARLRQLYCRLLAVEPELEGRKRMLVRDARRAIQRATGGLEAV